MRNLSLPDLLSVFPKGSHSRSATASPGSSLMGRRSTRAPAERLRPWGMSSRSCQADGWRGSEALEVTCFRGAKRESISLYGSGDKREIKWIDELNLRAAAELDRVALE